MNANNKERRPGQGNDARDGVESIKQILSHNFERILFGITGLFIVAVCMWATEIETMTVWSAYGGLLIGWVMAGRNIP